MIRLSYERYVNDHPEAGWSFSNGPREGINLEIRSYILEQCRLHEAVNNNADKDAFVFSVVDQLNVNKRITSFYDGQKRKFVKFVNKSQQELEVEKSAANKKARLDKVSNIK